MQALPLVLQKGKKEKVSDKQTYLQKQSYSYLALSIRNARVH